MTGLLSAAWFQANGSAFDRSAEKGAFQPRCVVYYYFCDKKLREGSTVYNAIHDSRMVGSVARCYTRKQIQATLRTRRPHYGDGTYVTFHERIDKAHPEVKRHHGEPAGGWGYRVVLRVRRCKRFVRIWQTGGVGLARPTSKPRKGVMLFIEEPEVEVMHIERLTKTGWRIAGP